MTRFEDESGDFYLGFAIRQMATLLVPVASTLREAAAKGDTKYLLEYLRSDQPLTSVDRDHLADLLSGQVSRPPGRPELGKPRQNRFKAIAAYKQLRTKGAAPKAAWDFIATGLLDMLGPDAFRHLAFTPKGGDVDDLAAQLSEWNSRPAKRK